jgi:hypothetical protein
MILVTVFIAILGISPDVNFAEIANKYGVSAALLESVCRYESDSGRIKHYKNNNGTWDVGLCMNHRKKSKKRPKIPGDVASVTEAAKELVMWRKVHNKYCVKHYNKTKTCGVIRRGKFRGVKNCTRNHHWFHHYNSGNRVLKNNYGNKVYCFMKNNNKKCSEKKWKKMKKEFFSRK